MKSLHLLFVFALGFVLLGCQSNANVAGTLIEGTLENAGGLTANLDRTSINGPKEMLKSSKVESDGDFEFSFEQELKPGTYQLRFGAQKASFIIEPGDKHLKFTGDVGNFSTYDFDVEGSAASQELATTLNRLREEAQSIDDIVRAVNEVKSSAVAAKVAYESVGRAGATGLPVHKAAVARMSDENPEKSSYSDFIRQMEQQIAMAQSRERIKVGQPAPDISLTSPEGKEYALEDLKGQVVLLDFWASWCGPCRRENPNVVKVYNKYKDQGFTIYSVSLDGIDPRRAGGMSAEQVAQANEGQKTRWVNAIKQDGLIWDYHVSELKKWSGNVSASYGVTGIPKTFLIDRDGKIAAVGLRGAGQIEQALQRVL